ncbi:SagB/ThcOx family dehydrogenase [Pseudomonas tolaasii]|uniref:SagB/ThcOx family dehydrogenase n=1 Tax=Pseudomonas tolaasii TaxID=29442 RepID=UPI0015A0EBC7|nr:SagB/ThcOx family dehydrogenase [Pseudomonas tolaasii]NWC52001.1 SagB/ThcOx family dehydrogenase [Pseudomonas tolaasii]NWE64284.1 SagB/ThcOx family dehydrogenase [Pseudomonas tolaasii]
MRINPYLFFLPKAPYFIIWDYKTHQQYELDLAHSKRLIELIHDISLYNNTLEIDSTFFHNSIIQESTSLESHWGWDDLSKIFHIGTKDFSFPEQPTDAKSWADRYMTHCQEVMKKDIPGANRFAHLKAEDLIRLPIPLPNESLLRHSSLEEALLQRKTCRSYLKNSITLEKISTLLYLSLGHLEERSSETTDLTPPAFRARRSSPSGGGLSSCEGYLYACNVRDLTPGLYYYHSAFHGLRLISRLNEPLGALLQGQHFIDNLPFGIFITSRFDKLWWKYPHSRAYRVALLEAGHISQTIQLIATAMGLNTWLSAAINDAKVEKALAMEDLREQLILFVGGGYSNGKVFCDEFEALLTKR